MSLKPKHDPRRAQRSPKRAAYAQRNNHPETTMTAEYNRLKRLWDLCSDPTRKDQLGRRINALVGRINLYLEGKRLYEIATKGAPAAAPKPAPESDGGEV